MTVFGQSMGSSSALDAVDSGLGVQYLRSGFISRSGSAPLWLLPCLRDPRRALRRRRKNQKTQEKWINAYCLRLFASVSYFTHARGARLYLLTGSKAARGRMPGKCCRRTRPPRPAERRCARGTRGALACGDFAEDGHGGDMDYPDNLGSYTRKVTTTSADAH